MVLCLHSFLILSSIDWYQPLGLLLQAPELVVQSLLSPPYYPFHQAREGQEIKSIDGLPLQTALTSIRVGGKPSERAARS